MLELRCPRCGEALAPKDVDPQTARYIERSIERHLGITDRPVIGEFQGDA